MSVAKNALVSLCFTNVCLKTFGLESVFFLTRGEKHLNTFLGIRYVPKKGPVAGTEGVRRGCFRKFPYRPPDYHHVKKFVEHTVSAHKSLPIIVFGKRRNRKCSKAD